MSIEDVIRAAVAAEVAPLREKLADLTAKVEAVGRALPPALVSPQEAATALGVSLSTVRRRLRDGSLPYRRVGRAVRVDLTGARPESVEEVARIARQGRRPT